MTVTLPAEQAWTPERIANVLDDTADYIETHGWYQGSYTPGTEVALRQQGPVGTDHRVPPEQVHGQPACLYGAIVLSQPQTVHTSGEWYVPLPVVSAMQRQVGCISLDTWNDTPWRTKQEVLDALRKSAKQQRRLADEVPA